MSKKLTSMQCDELELVIRYLDTEFEEGRDCLLPPNSSKWLLEKFNLSAGDPVPDPTYDMIRYVLKENSPDSNIFKQVTASTHVVTKKIKHDPVLTSIEKASHQDLVVQKKQLFKWIMDCVVKAPEAVRKGPFYTIKEEGETYPRNYFCQQWKLDGVSIGLYYKDGKLVAAGLRPRDGEFGEDVTEQAKYVQGIPSQLNLPLTCSIRGELIVKFSDFPKVQEWKRKQGEKEFSNTRSAAMGGIRQFNDSEKTQYHHVSFIAHGIERIEKPPYETEEEKAIWCNKNLGIQFVQTRPFNFYDLKKMEDVVASLDYRVDGVVISVDNLEEQISLGRHGDKSTGNPRGKIAWKFAEEKKPAVIKEIEWGVGRTGVIKPVAIFDPIRLADTDVRKSTLHNLGYMLRSEIGIGTEIIVQKAGNIIPKVVGVKSGKCIPSYPKNCPSCGVKTIIVNNGDMTELKCENPDCPAKKVANFCHFFKVLGCLGLGETTVEILLTSGKIHNRADFYSLSINDCIAAGFSERESLLVIAAIHMIDDPEHVGDQELREKIKFAIKTNKKIPAWKIIAGLGIPSAGEDSAKSLISQFGAIDKIREATIDEVVAVDGIGSKTATMIVSYLKIHLREIDRLLRHFEPEYPQKGKLSGVVMCLSGTIEDGKEFWKQKIEELGGKCVGSVSKKVNFLVAGEGSGEKTQKAKELGIEVLDIVGLRKKL